MMNAMYTTGPGIGFGLLWVLHVISVLAFFTGILFLIVFAIKTFTHAQLKNWALWLIVGGTVLCLFTIGVMGHTWNSYAMNRHYKLMNFNGNDASVVGMMGGTNGMMGGAKGMMDFDEDDEGSGMGMSMKGMTMMLQGKTGDAFDEAFLQMMIPHHQGAIEMAELAQKNAKHAELKSMADAIISAQQEEIDRMKAWQNAWGY